MGSVLGSFGAIQGNIWSIAPFIPVSDWEGPKSPNRPSWKILMGGEKKQYIINFGGGQFFFVFFTRTDPEILLELKSILFPVERSRSEFSSLGTNVFLSSDALKHARSPLVSGRNRSRPALRSTPMCLMRDPMHTKLMYHKETRMKTTSKFFYGIQTWGIYPLKGSVVCKFRFPSVCKNDRPGNDGTLRSV